jgi:hypothetical protein
MALVRDLFGLAVPDGSLSSHDIADDKEFEDQMAEVRQLPARGSARGRRRS